MFLRFWTPYRKCFLCGHRHLLTFSTLPDFICSRCENDPSHFESLAGEDAA